MSMPRGRGKGGGLTVEEMLEGAYYNGKGDAGNRNQTETECENVFARNARGYRSDHENES